MGAIVLIQSSQERKNTLRWGQIIFRNILSSPTFQSVFVFTMSGVVFAASSLALAKIMPKSEYAEFILFFALVQIGMALGPVGIDILVNRHKSLPSSGLLFATLCSSSFVGGITITVSEFLWDTSALFQLIVLFAVIGSSVNRLAAAFFQSWQRFGFSLLISQSQNLFLVAATIVAMAVEVFDAWLTCIVVAMGYALAGIFGWFKLLHKTQRDRSLRQSISAAEAISILGFSSALLFMIHIERLMIPRLLSIEALATFGVLMTVVGSPFHMLQLGISFTMLPRIRDANTGRRLRTLLKIESCFCFGIGILVGVIAWFIAPIMMDWVFSGKYVLSGGLILSAILCGLVKLLDSFVSTFITALGSSFELRLMGILSWVSFFVCVVGGYIGARWGLSGVIYGVGFGWFFRFIIATSFAVKYLRSR